MIEHPLLCMCEWKYKFKATPSYAEILHSTIEFGMRCWQTNNGGGYSRTEYDDHLMRRYLTLF